MDLLTFTPQTGEEIVDYIAFANPRARPERDTVGPKVSGGTHRVPVGLGKAGEELFAFVDVIERGVPPFLLFDSNDRLVGITVRVWVCGQAQGGGGSVVGLVVERRFGPSRR